MKRSIILSQRLLTAIGCANGNGGRYHLTTVAHSTVFFRHLGCEHAVNILRNSEHLQNVAIPLRWRKIVQETATGRHFAALAGVTQVDLL